MTSPAWRQRRTTVTAECALLLTHKNLTEGKDHSISPTPHLFPAVRPRCSNRQVEFTFPVQLLPHLPRSDGLNWTC
ncbi:hypothetical protein CEXT_325121 [Caerostris extrusa]|uniref:Uncharacterized protein n=1 Tax=Caerostris extrusa TaxID=172846 RepID=A0AAV4PVH7_CAEEX|nr:hypothetical protein CEXT_325121 [Caerostris extrusa]